MFTVVGAGFGLYGYLPAIVNTLGENVILAARYRDTLAARPELRPYLDAVQWTNTVEDALRQATAAVIAVPPQAQPDLVQLALSNSHMEKLIIEKPLAPSPEAAVQLIDDISKSGRRFRVGYTFLHTEWFSALERSLLRPCEGLSLRWTFRADHFRRSKQTWKRQHSMGGGPLRFYGIHLIATFASLGYHGATDGTLTGDTIDQPATWSTRLIGTGVPPCEIRVATDTEVNLFTIEARGERETHTIHAALSPFPPSESLQRQDVRIPILEQLIRSFESSDTKFTTLYSATNELWRQVELHCNVAH